MDLVSLVQEFRKSCSAEPQSRPIEMVQFGAHLRLMSVLCRRKVYRLFCLLSVCTKKSNVSDGIRNGNGMLLRCFRAAVEPHCPPPPKAQPQLPGAAGKAADSN